MRYPEFLYNGGRVGFVAPSFGVATEPYSRWFDQLLMQLKERGYQTVTGPNCRSLKGLGKSNTAACCGDEINDFFINDRSDIILSCGGGETMCEDLDYIDFKGIGTARPKWYMGYSDNTNLTFNLPTFCDTAAIYGPCAASLAMNPPHRSISDAWDLLTGAAFCRDASTGELYAQFTGYDGWEGPGEGSDEGPLPVYNTCRKSVTRGFVGLGRRTSGADCGTHKMNCTGMDTESMLSYAAPDSELHFKGRLLGGCLDLLDLLCGTAYDRVREFNERYGHEGILWFIEPCEFNSMGLFRGLWQLVHAGWFDKASGFIIGRPYEYGNQDYGMTMELAVLQALGGLGLPIIMDADLGHLPPMMPIISGAYGEATLQGSTLTLKQILR